MQKRIRFGLAGGVMLLVVGLVSPALLVLAPAGAATSGTTDLAGDTVIDPVEEPITAPRADIVASSADSSPSGITLAVRVDQSADPKTDANWSSSDTYASWQLDMTGDGKRDYTVEYSYDPDTKSLTASLDYNGQGRAPDGCDPRASYSATAGYSVVVDPKCLGGASAFTYRVMIDYNTNVKDDGADIATDASPDEGWAGPVAVTLLPGVTAPSIVASPQPATPRTLPTLPPNQNPGSAKARIDALDQASQTDPNPSSSAPTTTPGPTTKPASGTTAPKPGSGTVNTKAASGTRTGLSSDSGPATVLASDLARTGVSDRVGRMAGFATGIILIGIGILFANRRPALR